jgi:hypothetical protein
MHFANSQVTGRYASLYVSEPSQRSCTTTGKGLKEIANALDRERLEAIFIGASPAAGGRYERKIPPSYCASTWAAPSSNQSSRMLLS